MYSQTKALGLRPTIFCAELVGKSKNRVNPICDAPPCSLEPSWVALSIDAEIGVVPALDEEVPSFVAIRAPGLDRERLV